MLYFVAVGKKTRYFLLAYNNSTRRIVLSQKKAFLTVSTYQQHTLTY